MKCSCSNESCISEIKVDTGGHTLVVQHNFLKYPDGTPRDGIIFMDANAIVELIASLRIALNDMTNSKEVG